MVEELMGEELPMDLIKDYGRDGDKLNMTYLGLRLSDYVNGVTKTHMELSQRLFPGYWIRAITNGVHSYQWTCPCFRRLFDEYVPGWANEPELLVRVQNIPDNEIWGTHNDAKRILVDYVKDRKGVVLNSEILTIGFARRASTYKRTSFLFSDIQALRTINKRGRIQLIFAGNAHPKDTQGKELIKDVFRHSKELRGEIEIVYLENYDMEMAAKLTSGVDLWLNTPLPPLEASGTSGMKAAHNGVINFSILDGWWVEGCVEGYNGWAIGPSLKDAMKDEERRRRELDDLYRKLEYVIIPTYYCKRDEWIGMMKKSIAVVATYFNSHRMMRRYALEAYYK
jgi:starch phosphorylase